MFTNEQLHQQNSQAIDTLLNLTNWIGNDRALAEVFANQLLQEHRTLQQNFWRVIKMVAEKYKDFDHDMRNESSVKFAAKISEID